MRPKQPELITRAAPTAPWMNTSRPRGDEPGPLTALTGSEEELVRLSAALIRASRRKSSADEVKSAAHATGNAQAESHVPPNTAGQAPRAHGHVLEDGDRARRS
jgi:hypothetical protein